MQCDGFDGINLIATVENPPPGGGSVTATWTDANGGSQSAQMKPDGDTFTFFATGMSPRQEFTWTATMKAAKPAGESFIPCPSPSE